MAKAKVLKSYPNITNPNLQFYIGCPSEHSKEEAKQALQRICFKDVTVVDVEPVKSNCNPVCIWRVYYQLKNKDDGYEQDNNSNSSNIFPPELPEDEASLRQLYEDITAKSCMLGMQVVRKFHTSNKLTAIVEFSSKECECEIQHFNMVTEQPCMWPVTEVEINLSKMKIQM